MWCVLFHSKHARLLLGTVVIPGKKHGNPSTSQRATLHVHYSVSRVVPRPGGVCVEVRRGARLEARCAVRRTTDESSGSDPSVRLLFTRWRVLVQSQRVTEVPAYYCNGSAMRPAGVGPLVLPHPEGFDNL